jgi:hypothetical protein
MSAASLYNVNVNIYWVPVLVPLSEYFIKQIWMQFHTEEVHCKLSNEFTFVPIFSNILILGFNFICLLKGG